MLVERLTIEANDAVSSRLLRDVQRVVSSFHEGITVFDPRMRPGGHAAAHRALQSSAVETERVSLYCFTRALGEGNGRVEHRPRQQEHKLFTTIASHAVDLPRLLFQDARELFQNRVAGLMAVGVVHTLEAIQITQHHRDGLSQSSRVFEHFIEALLEVASVVELRQRIGLRHLEQPAVHLRQLALSFFESVLQCLDA